MDVHSLNHLHSHTIDFRFIESCWEKLMGLLTASNVDHTMSALILWHFYDGSRHTQTCVH
eukprot:c45353_g1_i1 orf=62-241(-)